MCLQVITAIEKRKIEQDTGDHHYNMKQIRILSRVVNTGLTKKMPLGQRLDKGEGSICRTIWGKSSPDSDEPMPRVWLGSLPVWSGDSRKAE